ncbi:MAG: molybdopterin-dependent oxidoreductase, partial [Candidatus Tectomicrobia bacterium]|nr:molybdopterin-dependent oxidoreductase [Candidatus Tectomicrobia bacterium]
TALWSDYVLPAAGWYEKRDVRYGTLYVPFVHLTAPAVSPLYESKPEWEIFCRLARAVEERARQRGLSTFTDRRGQKRHLDRLYQEMTLGGRYPEGEHEGLARDLVGLSTNLAGVRWEELKARGFARFTGVGVSPISVGSACDIPPKQAAVSFSWHTEKKQPWPTLTRRMQSYLDQELYLELGEALPTYKESPKVGGNFPLVMTGGHARWSIHAAWRDDAWMLRLQRGVPLIYLSTADARARGIADGDEVEVKNEIDSFRIRAKVSPAVRPGQVIIYHAWESYQFKGGKLFQNLMPSPLNPIELAGGYYHLRPMFTCLNPGQSDRDTRVEVVKAHSS